MDVELAISLPVFIIKSPVFIAQVNSPALYEKFFYMCCNLERVAVGYYQRGVFALFQTPHAVRHSHDLGGIKGYGFEGLILGQSISSSLGSVIG